MSILSEERVIVCEGCGCKWRVSMGKGSAEIIASLVECPLCENMKK